MPPLFFKNASYFMQIDGLRSREKSNQTHCFGRHLCGQVIKKHISKIKKSLSYFVVFFCHAMKG